MNKTFVIILCGIIFLTFVLFVGLPFEFLNPTVDRIATIILEVLILSLLIQLLRLSRHIKKNIIKWLMIVIVCSLSLLYLYCGYFISFGFSSYFPHWEDVSIYTNKDGKMIISQFREISGSIYDYRNRRIISDFGQFRISIDYPDNNMQGIWTEHDIKNDSTYTINLSKKE